MTKVELSKNLHFMVIEKVRCFDKPEPVIFFKTQFITKNRLSKGGFLILRLQLAFLSVQTAFVFG
jgi:hypothetical protein